jgi:hypothetical protein
VSTPNDLKLILLLILLAPPPQKKHLLPLLKGMNIEDLVELKPGKLRRDYLDDMTVVVVSLGGGRGGKRAAERGEGKRGEKKSRK